MRFQISGIPAVGIELMLDDQRYEAVQVAPHTRLDGGQSFLITWRAPCASCSQPFEQVTGSGGKVPFRNCGPCRSLAPPKPVSGRWGKRVKVEVRRP